MATFSIFSGTTHTDASIYISPASLGNEERTINFRRSEAPDYPSSRVQIKFQDKRWNSEQVLAFHTNTTEELRSFFEACLSSLPPPTLTPTAPTAPTAIRNNMTGEIIDVVRP